MIDFKIYGDTEQDTTTGKNLIPNTQTSQTINGVTLTNIGGSYKISGTATAQVVFRIDPLLSELNLVNGETYTYSANQTLPSGVVTRLEIYNNNNWIRVFTSNLDTSNQYRTATLNTTDGNILRQSIIITSGTNVNINNLGLMLEKGSQATSYEPYTGGIASPNPDYSQEVKVVTGDNTINITGKNLFSGFIKGKGLNNNTGEITTKSTGAISDYISVSFENNNKYYLSGITGTLRNYVAAYNSNKEFLGRTGATNRYYIGLNSGSFTAGTPQGTGDIKYVIVYQYEQSGSTTGSIDDVDNLQVQLEKGSTATNYEEYKGFTQEINLGKNLFDKTTVTDDKYIDTTGGEGSSTNYQASDYISIVPNTYITLSGNTQIEANYAAKLAFYDSSKTFISYQDMAIGNNTYLVPNNAKYTRFSIRDGDLDNIQLELGTQATQYSPYKEPIELCKIGNYQDYIYRENDKWYIHKKIDKVVLDGSESWAVSGTGTDNWFYYWYSGITPQSGNDLYSNYFVGVAIGGTNTDIGLFMPSNYIRIRTNTEDTSANFKTWLSTHNTIVYYVLATPTNTIIEDTELIEQLNKLMTQPLFENINHITDETFNLSPDLYVKYYRNTAINQNFASKDDLNNVKGTADKAYEQVQSTSVLYTTTNTINEPGASAVWLDTLPSVSDKYIWQKIVYTFLDASKNYESSPACIYTPSKITNELQYCLCSQNNYDETKITDAWQSESFP